jgi:glucose-6-phosphate 1-epimerase
VRHRSISPRRCTPTCGYATSPGRRWKDCTDVRFRESGYPGELRTDDATILRPEGEIDRVYVAVPGPVVVREPTRALEVASSGFADVVVWNPGAEKAAALADLERDGERRMLCVESAAVQQRPMLAPRERWTGEQRLTDITPQRERP